jgi:GINS complex subunit 2
MALPAELFLSPSPQELTFIAEEELIEIVPSFSMSRVRLISASPSVKESSNL